MNTLDLRTREKRGGRAERLHAEIIARTWESAVVAERKRLARDFHDTLAQGFSGVIVQVEAAADAISHGRTREAVEWLRRASTAARESLNDTRRAIYGLRAQVLVKCELAVALENLFRRMSGGTRLQADFVIRGKPRTLPAEWDEHLLRIGQEALGNVLRHARARQFTACLSFTQEGICLEMHDNGCGFDPAADRHRFGLVGMRERVERMGGCITVLSAKGAGTGIVVSLPVPAG